MINWQSIYAKQVFNSSNNEFTIYCLIKKLIYQLFIDSIIFNYISISLFCGLKVCGLSYGKESIIGLCFCIYNPILFLPILIGNSASERNFHFVVNSSPFFWIQRSNCTRAIFNSLTKDSFGNYR